MPNHIYNSVSCVNAEVLNTLLNPNPDNIGVDGPYVDFNRIIPMPPHQPDVTKPNPFWAEGPLGQKEEELYGKENCWYDWSIKHWGTKWNAYDTTVSSDCCITFFTAWSCPIPVLKKLSEIFPNDEIVVHTEDEGGGFPIDFTLKNGEVIYEDDKAPYEYYGDDEDEHYDEDDELVC